MRSVFATLVEIFFFRQQVLFIYIDIYCLPQHKRTLALYNACVKWGYESTGIKTKDYVAVQKKSLVMIYTLWKKDQAYEQNFKATLGNEEYRALFPLSKVPSVQKNNLILQEDHRCVRKIVCSCITHRVKY